MSQFFKKFIKDQSGATAIEYALIVLLISVTLVGGASTVGNSVSNTFDGVNNNF